MASPFLRASGCRRLTLVSLCIGADFGCKESHGLPPAGLRAKPHAKSVTKHVCDADDDDGDDASACVVVSGKVTRNTSSSSIISSTRGSRRTRSRSHESMDADTSQQSELGTSRTGS